MGEFDEDVQIMESDIEEMHESKEKKDDSCKEHGEAKVFCPKCAETYCKEKIKRLDTGTSKAKFILDRLEKGLDESKIGDYIRVETIKKWIKLRRGEM